MVVSDSYTSLTRILPKAEGRELSARAMLHGPPLHVLILAPM